MFPSKHYFSLVKKKKFSTFFGTLECELGKVSPMWIAILNKISHALSSGAFN
jgi:hypothetical protein